MSKFLVYACEISQMCLAASFVAASFLSESFASEKFCSSKFGHLYLPEFMFFIYMGDNLMRMLSWGMLNLVVLLPIKLFAMVYTTTEVFYRVWDLFNNKRFTCLVKIFPIMVMATMPLLLHKSTNILTVFMELPMFWAEDKMSTQGKLQLVATFEMVDIMKLQNTNSFMLLECISGAERKTTGLCSSNRIFPLCQQNVCGQ